MPQRFTSRPMALRNIKQINEEEEAQEAQIKEDAKQAVKEAKEAHEKAKEDVAKVKEEIEKAKFEEKKRGLTKKLHKAEKREQKAMELIEQSENALVSIALRIEETKEKREEEEEKEQEKERRKSLRTLQYNRIRMLCKLTIGGFCSYCILFLVTL